MSPAVPPLLMLAEGRRPRARKAPQHRHKEVELHMAVAGLLRRYARPDWRWGHYPAGEHRDVRTAAKLKAMGVQRGWADLLLFSPVGYLHALELKREGEGLTDDQEAFAAWFVVGGTPHAVAYTVDDALAALSSWGALRIKIGGAV